MDINWHPAAVSPRPWVGATATSDQEARAIRQSETQILTELETGPLFLAGRQEGSGTRWHSVSVALHIPQQGGSFPSLRSNPMALPWRRPQLLTLRPMRRARP